MKYRTKGVRLGHKLFNRVRETEFDKPQYYTTDRTNSVKDHTEMKGHEYAAFQKELFKKKKKERTRYRLFLLLTIVLTVLVILGFLIFWEVIDFSSLRSSLYQERR